MLGKLSVILIFFVSLLLFASNQTSTAVLTQQGFTCSGKNLFFEVQNSDGSWDCYWMNQPCKGEWSYYWAALSRRPGGTASTVQQSSNLRQIAPDEKTQRLLLIQNLEQSDIKLSYRVPASVLAAYRKRAHFPVRESVIVYEDQLPQWLRTMTERPSGAAAMNGICPGGLYPNPLPGGGTACYPCLGCHPCGDSYCSNFSAFASGDLAPVLAQKGYAISNGKIQKTNQLANPKN